MAYTTIVTGTTVSSSWANADVRDQVIVPFASTAARSSAITVPVNGQVSAITAADSTHGIYQYNGTSWRMPWNMPWGVLTSVQTTTSTSNSTSAQTIVTASAITVPANRLLRLTGKADVHYVSVADHIALQIQEGATVLQRAITWPDSNGADLTAVAVAYISPSAGSHTYKLNIAPVVGQSVGASASATYPAFLLIEDLGPNGAPS